MSKQKQKRVHILSTVNAGAISRNGDTITIRDVCGATDDIVMNGLLYPGDQLAAGAATLNDRPAPAGHPKNAAGQFVSANSGAALGAKWIGAYCTNARHEGGRTLVDVVFNSRMAKASDEAAALLARLEAAIAGTNSEPIHVSTGLLYTPVVANGESRGKKYSRIATNLQYDHLAILLNEAGAGKPEDGVGMFVNAQGDEDEVETVEVNSDPVDLRKESLLQKLVRKLWGNGSELSFDQIDSGLRALLPDGSWPREVYAREFVWVDREDRLWKQGYAIAADLSLALIGLPVEVTRKVEYVPITNEKDDQVKDTIIAALNAAGISGVAAMTDAELLAAHNALVAKPHIDALAAANSELEKFKTAANAAADTELNALAAALAVNSTLSVDQLKKLGLEDLRAFKTAAKAAPVTVGATNTATHDKTAYDTLPE